MPSRVTPGWSQVRAAYPRAVAGIVFGIALLLLGDLMLVFERVRYGSDVASA